MINLKRALKYFNFEFANKVEPDTKREIHNPSIHRLGLELAGKLEFTEKYRNIIGWGTKENRFFALMKKDERTTLLKKVIDERVPFIVLSIGISEELLSEIVEIADLNKTPVIKTELHLADITASLGTYFAALFSPSESIHASLVIVNGIGVVIKGKSGIGKSEATLELIQKGYLFVSDDTVIIKRQGADYLGFPPKITEGLLEARGIGLIDVPTIYGTSAVRSKAQINLIIELVKFDVNEPHDRLGNKSEYMEILNGKIRKIVLPIKEGRSISSLIEAAVNTYVARKNGINPLELINERSK